MLPRERNPISTQEHAPRRAPEPAPPAPPAREIGGPAGPEPTRYGDWERKGRCIDF
ncbi:MAG: DUF1674 domain-containing protein [Gammaproteobacteria bacterium]|nr:DUF1674 domain-containing protein [Gammaproteobacteria bacterium]MBV9620050.1 DUF1674 domain-containing protein [Gammaproteobacteria bacterium]